MKQPAQKNTSREKTTAVNISSQQKKLMIAISLFLIMAVLWMRVFMKKGGPKTAVAVIGTAAAGLTVEAATPKVEYIELPANAGRHDILTYDFFAGARLDNEVNMSDAAGQKAAGDSTTAAEQLELTAIVNGKKPQAFIGGTLLEKGQSFKFMFRGQAYIFKVVNILADRVELECNGVTITKKIPDLLSQDR